MNERGCYCELWGRDPACLESRGVPRGYCGFSQTCRKPGHIRHFPGAVPYTGCGRDFHYRRVSILHPIGSPEILVYGGLVVLLLVAFLI